MTLRDLRLYSFLPRWRAYRRRIAGFFAWTLRRFPTIGDIRTVSSGTRFRSLPYRVTRPAFYFYEAPKPDGSLRYDQILKRFLKKRN